MPKQTSVYLDDDVILALENKSQKDSRSISFLVNESIREYLKLKKDVKHEKN